MDSNQTPDIDGKHSRSTEVDQADKDVILVNSDNVDNVDQNNFKDTGIHKSNIKRLLSDPRYRIYYIIGAAVASITAVAFFNPFSNDEQISIDQSVSIATPDIQGQGNNVIPAEYVEHERQKQALAAQEAAEKGQSYLPQFKTVATDPHADLGGQNFLTGPNGQAINQSSQNIIDSSNITLQLDQMARSNAGGMTQTGNGGVTQTGNGGVTQTGNGGVTQTGNGGVTQQVDNTPIYQSSYTNQYANAQSATSDVQNVYMQQTAAYSEQNNQVKGLSQAAFIEQLESYTTSEKVKSGYSSIKYGQGQVTNNAKLQNLGNSSIATPNTELPPVAIIKAGTSMKARLDTGINTDKGKNLFATVIGGKFNGAKLLGTVNINTSDIEFNFNRMLFKGENYSINVRALTLGTKQSGMADKVQKHTMQRLGGLVAAGIFEGYGEAYQNLGTTQVTSNGNVISTKSEPNDKEIAGNIIGNVGTELSNVARNNVNRQPTYIVNAGKVFEVFFDDDVTSAKK